MGSNFVKGNVSKENTTVGDKVLYITSRMRGNGSSDTEKSFDAVVRGFNGDHISIEISGAIVHTTPAHLFKVRANTKVSAHLKSSY